MDLSRVIHSWSEIRLPLRTRPPVALSAMEQIFPTAITNVDPIDVLASETRTAHSTRPWLMSNMISSVDGAISVDGVSGGLGGPADKRVFTAIRAVSDVIVVASGTVIAEEYRKPQTPQALQDMRVARGQTPLPRIAIVTGSLSIDPGHQVFDADAPPIVITHNSSPIEQRDALAKVADILIAGETQVDLEGALEQLGARGATCVLLEGGPTLNGAFAAADLIDEWCLSSAPLIVGGSGGRAVKSSHTFEPRRYALARTLHEDGNLFHRYLRTPVAQ